MKTQRIVSSISGLNGHKADLLKEANRLKTDGHAGHDRFVQLKTYAETQHSLVITVKMAEQLFKMVPGGTSEKNSLQAAVCA